MATLTDDEAQSVLDHLVTQQRATPHPDPNDVKDPLVNENRKEVVYDKGNPIEDDKAQFLLDHLISEQAKTNPVQEPSVMGDLYRGIDNLEGSGGGLVSLLGNMSGLKSVEDWGMDIYKANQFQSSRNPAKIGDWENIHGIGDGLKYAEEGIMENLPMFVPGMVTGGIGTLTAKNLAKGWLEKTVAEQVAKGMTEEAAKTFAAKTVAKKVALSSAISAATASIPQEQGSIYGDTYDETGKKIPLYALGAGALAGGIDAIPEARIMTKVLGPKLGGEITGHIAKRMGIEAAKQAMWEMPTEVMQSIIEESANSYADPSRSVTDNKSLNDYINTALKTTATGLFMGSVGGIRGERYTHDEKIAMAKQDEIETKAKAQGTKVNSPITPEAVQLDPNAVKLDSVNDQIKVLVNEKDKLPADHPRVAEIDTHLNDLLSQKDALEKQIDASTGPDVVDTSEETTKEPSETEVKLNTVNDQIKALVNEKRGLQVDDPKHEAIDAQIEALWNEKETLNKQLQYESQIKRRTVGQQVQGGNETGQSEGVVRGEGTQGEQAAAGDEGGQVSEHEQAKASLLQEKSFLENLPKEGTPEYPKEKINTRLKEISALLADNQKLSVDKTNPTYSFPKSEVTDKSVTKEQTKGKRNEVHLISNALVNENTKGTTEEKSSYIGAIKAAIESHINLLTGQKVNIRAGTGFKASYDGRGNITITVPKKSHFDARNRSAARNSGTVWEHSMVPKLVEEEVIHAAHIAYMRDSWDRAGRKGDFKEYVSKNLKKEYDNFLKSYKFMPEELQKVYAPNGTEMSPEDTMAEFYRAMVQRARTGMLTEDMARIQAIQKQQGGATKIQQLFLDASRRLREVIARYLNPATSTKSIQDTYKGINDMLDRYGVVRPDVAPPVTRTQAQKSREANAKNESKPKQEPKQTEKPSTTKIKEPVSKEAAKESEQATGHFLPTSGSEKAATTPEKPKSPVPRSERKYIKEVMHIGSEEAVKKPEKGMKAGDQEGYQETEPDENGIKVAKQGNAYAKIKETADEVHIIDLAVHPKNEQSKGQGGALLEKIKRDAEGKLVTLNPSAKDESRQGDLERFYENHGFTRSGNEYTWQDKSEASDPSNIHTEQDLKNFLSEHGFLAGGQKTEDSLVDENGNEVEIDPLGIEAHHGTPHEVDKFDTGKIGTGEGAQIYGWGLYFAQARAVAEEYAKTLYKSKLSDAAKDTAKYWIDQASGDKERAVEMLNALREERGFSPNEDDEIIDAIREKGGNVYKVKINANPDELLHWDKPLSEQSQKIQNLIPSLSEKLGYEVDPESTGKKIYLDLERAFFMHPNENHPEWMRGQEIRIPIAKIASEYLNSLGVKGIQYLDQASRDSEDESSRTHNYVVFNHQDIKITHANDSLVDESGFAAGEQYTGLRDEFGEAEDHLNKVFSQSRVESGESRAILHAPSLDFSHVPEVIQDTSSVPHSETILEGVREINKRGLLKTVHDLREDPTGGRLGRPIDVHQAVMEVTRRTLDGMIERYEDGSSFIKDPDQVEFLYESREMISQSSIQSLTASGRAGSLLKGFKDFISRATSKTDYYNLLKTTLNRKLGQNGERFTKLMMDEVNKMVEKAIEGSITRSELTSYIQKIIKDVNDPEWRKEARKTYVENDQKLSAIIHEMTMNAASKEFGNFESEPALKEALSRVTSMMRMLDPGKSVTTRESAPTAISSALNKVFNDAVRSKAIVNETPAKTKIPELQQLSAIVKSPELYDKFVDEVEHRLLSDPKASPEFISRVNDVIRELRNQSWTDGLIQSVVVNKAKEMKLGVKNAVKTAERKTRPKLDKIHEMSQQAIDIRTEAIRDEILKELGADKLDHDVVQELAHSIDQELERQVRAAREQFAGTPGAVRKTIKSIGETIGAIAKANWKNRQRFIDDLAHDFVTKLGVTDTPSFPHATTLKEIFRKAAEEEISRQREVLKKNLEKRAKALDAGKTSEVLNTKNKAGKSAIDMILDAASLGALNDKKMYVALQDYLKLPKYSEAVAKRIADWGEEIANMPLQTIGGHANRERTIQTQQLMNYIASQKGLSWKDMAQSYMYVSLLSGPGTHIVNAYSNAANLIGEIAVQVARNPNQIGRILSGMLHVLPRATIEFKDTLAHGITAGKDLYSVTGSMPLEFDNPLYIGDNSIEKGTAKGLGWLLTKTNAKMVGRFLAASDMFFYKAAQELKYVSLTGFRDNGGELWNGTLKRTEERFERNARAAGVEFNANDSKTKREIGIAALQEFESKRLLNENDRIRWAESSAYALRTTFNQDPVGPIGELAKMLGKWTEKWPMAKPLIPFTKVVANVLNAQLDWSPLGFNRWYWSKDSAFNQGFKDKNGVPIRNPEILTRAIIGTAGFGLLLGMVMKAHADDPDDPWLDIFGDGPRDANKRRQLYDRGWKPNTIKIGRNYISYQNNPMALPMAAVGSVMDRYKDNKNGDIMGYIPQAALAFARSMLNQSFVSGISGMVSALESSSPDKEMANFMARTSSIAIPSLFKQIDSWVSPGVQNSSSFIDMTIKQIPIVRQLALHDPMLNVFGEKVTRVQGPLNIPFSNRFWTMERTGDPVYEFIGTHQILVPGFARNTKLGDKPMTERQFYDYVKLAGPMMKERIRQELPRLISLTREEQQKRIEEITHEAKSEARDILRKM